MRRFGVGRQPVKRMSWPRWLADRLDFSFGGHDSSDPAEPTQQVADRAAQLLLQQVGREDVGVDRLELQLVAEEFFVVLAGGDDRAAVGFGDVRQILESWLSAVTSARILSTWSGTWSRKSTCRSGFFWASRTSAWKSVVRAAELVGTRFRARRTAAASGRATRRSGGSIRADRRDRGRTSCGGGRASRAPLWSRLRRASTSERFVADEFVRRAARRWCRGTCRSGGR